MIDYKSIEATVHTAGQTMLNARLTDQTIHRKEGLANFCTDFDVQIQQYLIAELSRILPGAGFFGEEDTQNSRSTEKEYVFYIDPIDGTTNFMFAYNHSCVSVGLAHNGQMIAGFIYNPYVEEMYTAVRGEGAFLNGRRLTIENLSLEEGIVAFGCARYNLCDFDTLFSAVKQLFHRSLSIRTDGSAALGISRVASGSNAVYLEFILNPYDYAAASVIVEEAGGLITQIDGTPISLQGPCSILCATPAAWKETQDIVLELGYREP